MSVTGTTTGQTQDANLGELVINGFEASATYSVGGWDLFLTHNVSDFDTSNLNTSSVSESFREIGDTTSYEIGYFFEERDISVALNGQFVQAKETSLGEDKESYNLHNVMARWDNAFGYEGLSLTGGIDNIFDTTYTSHASRLGATTHPVFGPLILNDVEAGRNYKLTIAKTF